MPQENTANKEQLKQMKTAYSQLANDTFDLLVNLPVEAVKKLVQATIDTQSEVLGTLASNGKYAPAADISQNGYKLLQFYVNQVQQNKEVASKALGVFTEAALAWQKVAAETQKSAVDTYTTWLGRTATTSAQ